MTICHKRKLIFINIPKNAGTSIVKAMGVENMYMDRTIDEYKEHYDEYWDKYKKFTVVRDPIDRFISAYKFARMKESGWFSVTGEEGLEKHHHYDLCNEMDINEYTSYIFKNQEKLNRWNVPQTFLISNDQKNIPPDKIDYFVRFENLQEDLSKIGIKRIEKLNSSEIDDDKVIQLTKKSKMRLYSIYDIDYKNFNYRKESLFDYS